MKETQIKIADLLLSVGSTDTVSVEGVILPRIPGLQKGGMTLTVSLYSIDDSTIIATIDKLHCFLDDVSDVSGKHFVREIIVSDYVGKFILDDSSLVDDGDDSLFSITGDHIDMEEMLYQAIQIQEPLIKRSPEEQELYDSSGEDIDPLDGGDVDSSDVVGGVVTIRQ